MWGVHIADGQLDRLACLAGWMVGSMLLLLALRKTNPDSVPRIAVLAAVFFIASLLHVPTFFGTKTHLLLTGLLGILLGWRSIVAVACGLSLQAILLSHGGVFSFGINLLVMGLPALGSGIFFQRMLSAKSLPASNPGNAFLQRVAFACGFGSVTLVVILYAAALWVGGVADWRPQIAATCLIHIPLAFLEGFICAGVVAFQSKVAPESLSFGESSMRDHQETETEENVVIKPPVEANQIASPPTAPDQP